MAVMAKWYLRTFEISPNVIRGFRDLAIKGSCETEEKTEQKEKYIAFKNTQPTEISFTAHLNAYLGCDVRNEAKDLVNDAKWGHSDFLYIYEKGQSMKLFKARMMLTSAAVSAIEIAPNGQWVSCDVALDMKVCSLSDGSIGGGSSGGSGGSGGGGGYTKKSVKSTSAKGKIQNGEGTDNIKEATADQKRAQLNARKQLDMRRSGSLGGPKVYKQFGID